MPTLSPWPMSLAVCAVRVRVGLGGDFVRAVLPRCGLCRRVDCLARLSAKFLPLSVRAAVRSREYKSVTSTLEGGGPPPSLIGDLVTSCRYGASAMSPPNTTTTLPTMTMDPAKLHRLAQLAFKSKL